MLNYIKREMKRTKKKKKMCPTKEIVRNEIETWNQVREKYFHLQVLRALNFDAPYCMV